MSEIAVLSDPDSPWGDAPEPDLDRIPYWMEDQFADDDGPTLWDVLGGDVEPGWEAIRVLETYDLRQFDDETRGQFVEAWSRQEAWVQSRKLNAVDGFVHPVLDEAPMEDEPADRRERALTSDLRSALKASDTWANHQLWLAHTLATSLPKTAQSLASGRIGTAQANTLALAISACTPALTAGQCAQLERRLYPRAEQQTLTQFKGSVRRAIAAISPQSLEDAFERARKDTDVTWWPEDAAMASLRLYAPAPDVLEVRYALNDEAWGMAKLAKARGEERRPIGWYRAQVLLRWARASTEELAALGIRVIRGDDTDGAPGVDGELVTVLPASDEPLVLKRGQSKPRRQVGMIMDLPVALGFQDGTAELEDYGPIPPSLAREIAQDAAWRRVVLEPIDGHLLDYGRERYRPTQKMRDFLVGLAQRCRVAGCNRRAVETDHGIDWVDLGRTSSFNCNGLCKHHHALKTNNGFKVVNHIDGSMEWVSPSGRRTVRPPDDLRITNYGLHPSDPAYVTVRRTDHPSPSGTDPPDSG